MNNLRPHCGELKGRLLLWFALGLAPLAGSSCGAGEEGNVGPGTLTLAKTPAKSGDLQTGSPGQPLPSPLRVLVTRNAEPVAGTRVAWSPTTGSLNPASSTTDASGVATTVWTLGSSQGTQTAQALLNGATGSPVTFTATAGSQPGGGGPPGPPPPGGNP